VGERERERRNEEEEKGKKGKEGCYLSSSACRPWHNSQHTIGDPNSLGVVGLVEEAASGHVPHTACTMVLGWCGIANARHGWDSFLWSYKRGLTLCTLLAIADILARCSYSDWNNRMLRSIFGFGSRA